MRSCHRSWTVIAFSVLVLCRATAGQRIWWGQRGRQMAPNNKIFLGGEKSSALRNKNTMFKSNENYNLSTWQQNRRPESNRHSRDQQVYPGVVHDTIFFFIPDIEFNASISPNGRLDVMWLLSFQHAQVEQTHLGERSPSNLYRQDRWHSADITRSPLTPPRSALSTCDCQRRREGFLGAGQSYVLMVGVLSSRVRWESQTSSKRSGPEERIRWRFVVPGQRIHSQYTSGPDTSIGSRTTLLHPVLSVCRGQRGDRAEIQIFEATVFALGHIRKAFSRYLFLTSVSKWEKKVCSSSGLELAADWFRSMRTGSLSVFKKRRLNELMEGSSGCWCFF